MIRISTIPCVCMFLLAVYGAGPLRAAEGEPAVAAADHIRLRVGRLKGMFTTVDFKDTKVAVEFWVTRLCAEMGIRASATLELLPDLDAAVAGMAEGRIDIVTLSPLDYLKTSKRVPVDPISVGVIDGKTTDEFVLLVRRDLESNGLEQLKGKTIAVESARYAYPVGSMWLETELLRARLGSPDDFFGDVKTEARASKAVIGTFFGHVGASLVTRRAYATMVELNPQVGEELTVLLQSPPFLREILCARASYAEGLRDTLIEAALKAHRYPTGRQILQLFGQERVVRFEAGYLRTVRLPVQEHESLLNRSTAAGPRP